VFERFTERARQVVVLAQDEARALKHNYIGTEHILLGLIREQEGIAARVLASLRITVEEVRAQVTRIVGQGDEVRTGQIPFTPRAKKVLELALREALSLGHDYIGTEHILLGLVRLNEGVAAQILLGFGADAEKIRDEVIRTLSGVGPVAQESTIELVLRRVVPIGQQFSDGTWVLSVEVWDHGLVVNLARSEPWPLGSHPPSHGLRVTDEAGTSYDHVGGHGGGSLQGGFRYELEFAPAPPPASTALRISHGTASDVLSVSLRD
jgi:Clp amino terminal domain, pathogenicity island component